MPRATKKTGRKLRLAETDGARTACGLCGSARRITQTECCGNFICDDADKYVMFSYARNSCYRNHSHQTLCAFHHNEEHGGDWKLCSSCRENFEPEMYAWYATNEFNFAKLENPPAFEPTLCEGCGKRIVLPEGGYILAKGKYWCERCDHSSPAPGRSGSRARRQGV